MKNYYEILEVNEKASKEIIKKIFKIHIKNNHPDLFEGDEKILMEEKVKKINEAYEVLSNEDKRKKYDEELKQSKENLNNEKSLILMQENQYLKELLQKKEKLINDFLNTIDEDFDDNEYSNHTNNYVKRPFYDINDNYNDLNTTYNNSEDLENQRNSTQDKEKNNKYKKIFSDFLYENNIIIKKIFFSMFLIIIGLIFIEKLTGFNLLDIFFKTLLN